jgi:hypothetical protein
MTRRTANGRAVSSLVKVKTPAVQPVPLDQPLRRGPQPVAGVAAVQTQFTILPQQSMKRTQPVISVSMGLKLNP